MLRRAPFVIALTLAVASAGPVAQGPGADGPSAGRRTPIFVCGSDEALPNPIPLRWATVVLAGDSRLYTPCPAGDPDQHASHREARERALLAEAIAPAAAARLGASAAREVLWRGVQAHARLRAPVGRLQPPDSGVPVVAACHTRAAVEGAGATARRWQPGVLLLQMRSTDARVRREAAYGLGLALGESAPELVPFALEELRACLERETVPDVRAEILASLGVVRDATDEQRADIEALLVAESRSPDLRVVVGAATGLEALLRLAPWRPIAEATRERLRALATAAARGVSTEQPDEGARVRRLAMMALQTARDGDIDTLRRAAGDTDWQVRRLAVMRLNLADEAHAAIAAPLFASEPAPQVRFEVTAALARRVAETRVCAPLVDRLSDPAPVVAMRAMDGLIAACTDADAAAGALVAWADRLDRPDAAGTWHLPSRALTALARLRPDEARARLAAAVRHPVWQVRAAAAAMSPALGADDAAVALARDPVANVRTAALDALARLKHAGLVSAAIAALGDATDYQLLRTAAMVLRGAPAEARHAASNALLAALARLTAEDTDTSRDPRVAILDRLGELLDPARSRELLPYVADYDDAVIAAARRAYQARAGMPPPHVPLRRRYPYQPSEAALGALPREAELVLEEGTVIIELLSDVAPVTVARFAELAARGAYDGTTFHRVVPNFVVQGGSPGANEYAGATTRYLRDEVGPQASHVRGAVGISTRGRDTGDAQIFIDLVDLPRLDRDYTVFGYVRSGMDLVDRLLEGGAIKAVRVR